MNTLLLKYALEVAKSGSITHAAEALYMAQPNLSKAIKELEEILGYEVFARSSKGMFPTTQGKEFLVYAKSVLKQLDKIMEIGDEGAKDVQTFDVSIPRGSYIAQGFTKFAITLDQERGIDLSLQETNSVQTISNVAQGTFHLGIIRYQVVHENYFRDYLKNKNLVSEDIWEFKLGVIMSKNDPLAKEATIQYKQLNNYTEIIHGDNSVPYLMKDASENKDKNIKKKISVYERYNQFDLLERMQTSYMWASPIPDNILERHGLVQRGCKEVNHVYKDVLIYEKGYHLKELDKEFIAIICEEQRKVAQKEFQ